MTIEQALSILDQATSVMHLTRVQHSQMMEAINLIKKTLNEKTIKEVTP